MTCFPESSLPVITSRKCCDIVPKTNPKPDLYSPLMSGEFQIQVLTASVLIHRDRRELGQEKAASEAQTMNVPRLQLEPEPQLSASQARESGDPVKAREASKAADAESGRNTCVRENTSGSPE